MKHCADRQIESNIMKSIEPDLKRIGLYIDNMTIKSALVGGFDKIDVYRKMQQLCGRYNKLIVAKITALLKSSGGINDELTAQNVLLTDRFMNRPQVQPQAEEAARDSDALLRDNERLVLELKRLKIDYGKLWAEKNICVQRIAELEADIWASRSASNSGVRKEGRPMSLYA